MSLPPTGIVASEKWRDRPDHEGDNGRTEGESPGEWRNASGYQDDAGHAAGKSTLEKGALHPSEQSAGRARQLGWKHEAKPDIGRLDPQLAGCYGFSQVRRMGALPAYRQDNTTIVWVRPDLSWDTLLEVQAEFGAGFKPVMIPEDLFNRALQRAFERAGAAADAVQDLGDVIDLEAASAGLPETADLLDSQDDAPIIRLLNAVMTQAIEEGASDIHIEPFETRLVIRFRVDGLLHDVVEPPVALSGRIIARVKVLARLNIAEKRVPQDGRISLRLGGRMIDVRVSTLPTHYGERVVMRILEKEQGTLTLEQVGMSEEVRNMGDFPDCRVQPSGRGAGSWLAAMWCAVGCVARVPDGPASSSRSRALSTR